MKDALPAALPGLPLVGNVAEAVVKENLRLCPPAWTVYRVAEEDTEVGGHTIVAATEVWTSQWVVHRDGRFFERPDAFVPERWLAASKKPPQARLLPLRRRPEDLHRQPLRRGRGGARPLHRRATLGAAGAGGRRDAGAVDDPEAQGRRAGLPGTVGLGVNR